MSINKPKLLNIAISNETVRQPNDQIPLSTINQTNRPQYLDVNLLAEEAYELQRNNIIPLVKPCKKNYDAKYYCTVCDYACILVDAAYRHKSSKSHQYNYQVKKKLNKFFCFLYFKIFNF
jgi:hypothetical protein